MIIDKESIYINYPLATGNPNELNLFEYNASTHVASKTTDVSFQIGKTYYVSMGGYLLDTKLSFNKLWSSNAGRNLAGSFSGLFNGIYPKITMQIRKLKKSEIEFLTPVLDSSYQTTIYYDPKEKSYISMETYSSDWELSSKSIVNEIRKINGFQWSVIATKKRS